MYYIFRHMGLAVDEEDSPSPPPPPPQGLLGPHGWPPLPLRLPPPPHLTLPHLAPPTPHALPLTPVPPTVTSTPINTPVLTSVNTTSIRVKRQFDVASLLASENNTKDIVETTKDMVEVGNNNNDSEETSEAGEDSWRSVSPQPQQQPQLMPHQYLARYYQLVQQQNSAAAAAALAAAAAAASSVASEKFQTSSPRVSPHTPDRTY